MFVNKMGIDESKLAGPQKFSDQFLPPCSRVSGRPWKLVQSCSVEAWRKKYCGMFSLLMHYICSTLQF